MDTKKTSLLAKIDCNAIIHNCTILKQLTGPNVRFCPAVKCNAYGHGIQIVLDALNRFGAQMVCVAGIAEAAQVRELNWKKDILILGSEFSIYSDSDKKQIALWLVENNIRLTVSEKNDIEPLSLAAQKLNTKAFVHFKLDSGMTRMGLDEIELMDLIRQTAADDRIRLEGLYTHLATADHADKTFALRQIGIFNRFIEKLNIPIPIIHAANSAATIDIPSSHFNMIRPGISIYGYQPGSDMTNRPNLKPALKLVSYIMLVKKVTAGSFVGYGCTYQAKQDSFLAIVPIGYGDGYDRRLSSKGQMKIEDQFVPVVGRISMDMTVINVTALIEKGFNITPGTEVTIIDNNPQSPNSVESIAKQLNTIPYEITTRLGQRITRQNQK